MKLIDRFNILIHDNVRDIPDEDLDKTVIEEDEEVEEESTEK